MSAEVEILDAGSPVAQESARRRTSARRATFEWLGRLALGASIVAGTIVGAQSGIGLLWFVPFSGVGTLLVIRRPRASIGWLLLGLGWAFALTSGTIEATAAEFAAGTMPWPTLLWSVLNFAAPALVFYQLAVLAMVFPTGRLPGGRWARPAGLAVAVALVLIVLVVVSPHLLLTLAGSTATVAVPNPIAVLPDFPAWQVFSPEAVLVALMVLLAASVVSLVVRLRRARGIERQQLRWFGAALVFVVIAVGVGLLFSTLVPGSSEAGYAWYLAIAAFPTVPIAIGVAVLRYRLYEIDTIINRAIVYGLLTAILAGGSAAAIGILERLFEGVAGPGSDATIILTTLVVVTAFTPVKARLQVLVDRRFKEAHEPEVDLPAFVAEARRSLGSLDVDRTLRRFLETAVTAYGAHGGSARIGAGTGTRSIVTGSLSATPGATASAAHGGLAVEVALSGGDASRNVIPLREALEAVLAELAAERRAGPERAGSSLG